MEIIVYTSITGNKDDERDDIQVFNEYDQFKDPSMNAKIYKILPHKFIDTDISIYVDGNIFLNEPKEKIAELLEDNDIAVFKHPHRESIHWEIRWIEYKYRHDKESPILKNALKQFEHYKGFPRKTGIANCGFIIRRHNERTKRFNEAWWAEITRWSSRDQLSFPVIRREMPEVKVRMIEGDILNNKYLSYKPHRL